MSIECNFKAPTNYGKGVLLVIMNIVHSFGQLYHCWLRFARYHSFRFQKNNMAEQLMWSREAIRDGLCEVSTISL